LDAIAEVRWVRPTNTETGDAGMGLEFLQMSPGNKQAVKDFIIRRESIFFEL
jgi:c-di-GMP-binding flagellar brake protein YcgR